MEKFIKQINVEEQLYSLVARNTYEPEGDIDYIMIGDDDEGYMIFCEEDPNMANVYSAIIESYIDRATVLSVPVLKPEDDDTISLLFFTFKRAVLNEDGEPIGMYLGCQDDTKILTLFINDSGVTVTVKNLA